MNDCLQVQNLTKDYGKFLLDSVSFNLPSGSIMGFIGENGAGKTTTIKLLLNQIARNSGTVTVFGKDNLLYEKEIKQQLGVVLDESYFHSSLRPGDIAKIMRGIFPGWDDVLFQKYLRSMSLPEDKTVKELSRGMRMKLSIATALSHRPWLLILDEATSGLDPVVRSEILDLLLDFIQDESHSVLISSHITSDLEKVCDYITFIHNGRVVTSQSKDAILYNYGLLRCGTGDFGKIDRADILGYRKNQFGYDVLVNDKHRAQSKYRGFVIDGVNLEDLRLDHAQGRPFGLAEIFVVPGAVGHLSEALTERGWRLHG